jgi:hypothetical protein
MSEQTNPETFAEFKTSFSYGSRTDLNFKFLKGLPEAEAAQFFQDLLTRPRAHLPRARTRTLRGSSRSNSRAADECVSRTGT